MSGAGTRTNPDVICGTCGANVSRNQDHASSCASRPCASRPMTLGIHFGALAKPIVTQLRAQGIRRPTEAQKAIHHLQLDADAVARLAVRGYLSDGGKRRCHEKIMRELTTLLSSRGGE